MVSQTAPVDDDVPAAQPDHAGRHALLVLLPDLMVDPDAWEGLVRRLEPLRLDVVAVTACRLRPHQFGSLYAGSVVKQQGRGRVSAGWLGQQLAALDMSVPLLVRTPLPIALTELITEWKGPSGYGARHRGDLRELGPASDRCASLFHTADSAAEAERDASLFFGRELTARLLSGHRRRHSPLTVVPQLRMYLPPGTEPHPYDLVMRCLLRGLTLLGHDALLPASGREPAADRAGQLVVELRRRLVHERGSRLVEVLHDGLGPVAEAVCRLDGLLPDAVDRDRVSRARADLLAALGVLSRPASWGIGTGSDVAAVFAANGLHLDAWEEHRLATATTFFPRPRRP